MKLSELLNMWKVDAKIDQSKLDEESINTSILHSRYLEILSGVKITLKRERTKQKKIELQVKRWLLGKMTKEEMDELGWEYDPWKGESKPMKSEIDSHVNIQPIVIEQSNRTTELEVMHDALIDIVNNLNWRHQSIRNSIDFMRFTSGG